MVVAAILHLGNVEFAKGEEIDSSVIKDEKSRFHLNMTAELLKYVTHTHYFDMMHCFVIFYLLSMLVGLFFHIYILL